MSQPMARAYIFDLLGDFARVGGDEIKLKALVALGETLGISPPTMRVTAARMREEGWLAVRREGREAYYSMTRKTLHLLDEGRQRIFRPKPGPWSGEWSMVIYTVPESDRATREKLRRDLTWLGYGSLAPATWVSPHPSLDRVADVGAALPNARLELVTMRATDVAADRSIAERCWDLAELNKEYDTFIRGLRLKLPRYRTGRLDGAEALEARINLVHAYRHFPYRDPGLPAELQPPAWLGERARTLFNEAHDLLLPGSLEYYESVIGAPVGRGVTVDH
ncbi:MAG TPA: PaaX family transcriptional regulator C-terminal domain-containing protein [Mycobacteriales bacterium]|nr:PaaX family transcriptional regulator C-terminal domain-containing protein [Mycobacteriales bacterium]